jgi:hypothetical protein
MRIAGDHREEAFGSIYESADRTINLFVLSKVPDGKRESRLWDIYCSTRDAGQAEDGYGARCPAESQ